MRTAVLVAAVLILAGCGTSSSAGTSSPSWSRPTQIEHGQYQSVYAVSCPVTGFCKAVDENGGILTLRGGHWLTPAMVASGTLTSVSCSSMTFCIALSVGGTAATFQGRQWAGQVVVGPQSNQYSLSCSGPSQCVAVNFEGLGFTLDGNMWSPPMPVAGTGSTSRYNDVSCASKSFCMAVGAVGTVGQVSTFNGSAWSVQSDSPTQPLLSVSCPTTTFCNGLSAKGSLVFSGGKWSKPIDSYLSISCMSANFCMAVGLSGAASSWSDGHWSNPVQVMHDGYSASSSVSCASPRFCVMVNSKGAAATYR